MKPPFFSFLIIFGLFLCGASAQNKAGNYIIIINGDSLFVDLNSTTTYRTSSGEELDLQLVQPNYLTYSDDMVSFQYEKSYSVAKSSLDAGIDQLMVMKASGNGFMIQEYSTFDPSPLLRLMLNELVKESVSYGYDKVEEDFEHTLASGQIIKGVKAILTYRGERETYTVATYGQRDSGLVFVTMLLNEDFKEEDQPLIDLFLETLEVK